MHAPLKGKFKQLSVFEEPLKSGYSLLPFRFIKLGQNRNFLTNMVGEYLILSDQDLKDFVAHRTVLGGRLYNDLKSKHFLYDNDSRAYLDLLALKYRTRMEAISQFTSLHMFVVSLRCEHSCPYCQVSRQSQDKQKYDMTRETALKGLDFVFRSPSPAIKIEFQGGEALLNFELVKFIVKEAKERNKTAARDLQFVIATNLAVLSDEVLNFCLAENVYLSTSLDGPADLHNANRPRPGGDSHQRAVDGIRRIKEVLGPDYVGALMTTTKASLSRPRDIVDEYVRMGFNSIFLRPLSPYGFAIKTKSFAAYNMDEWLRFYREGLEHILALNRRGHFFVEQYASLVLNKMLTPLSTNYVDLQSPAGIGISAIIFNYDGDVYASDESRMLAEMGEKRFRLGNLHRDSYETIMTSENLLAPLEASLAESSPMCSECAFLPYCGSEPVYHVATQGDYVGHKAFSGFCRRNMGVFKLIIDLLEGSPENRELMMSWIRV